MSSTLTVLLSGVVGVDPRILFLTTSADESTVLTPGFLNPIEDISGVDISEKDFILAVYQNGERREIFLPVFGPGRIITLQGIAGDGSAPGGLTGAVNIGAGDGVFAGISGSDLELKSFLAGPNITISDSGDDLTISAIVPGGGGTIKDGVNLGAGEGVFASVVGSDMEFKSLVAGTNVSLVSNLDEITINASITGGYDYLDTFWVAQNGNNANDGKSIDSPKLTIAGAIAAFTTPTTKSIINIADEGTYTVNYIMTSGQNIFISAPGASINSGSPGVAAFTLVSGATLAIACNIMSNNTSGDVITYSTGGIFQPDIYQMFGNISGPGTTIGNIDFINGDISKSAGTSEITNNHWTGAYSGTGTSIFRLKSNFCSGAWTLADTADAFGDVTDTGAAFSITNAGTGFAVGTFGSSTQETLIYGENINLTDQYLAQEVSQIIDIISPGSGNFTPQPNQSGAKFLVDDTANVTCTLLTYVGDPSFPAGYHFYIEQKNSGNVQCLSGDTIESVSNKDWTEGRGAIVRVDLMGTFVDVGPVTRYIWGLSGQLAGSAVTSSGINIYVSALSGSDTTGIGSFSQPYATIQAAVTAIGAPSTKVNIVVIDDEDYFEEVTISDVRINLIAPQARLVSSAGDALTISASGGIMQVVLRDLASTFGGGNALNATGNCTTYLNIETNSQGNIQQNDGILFIRANNISGDLVVAGTGTIDASTNQFAGGTTPGAGTINLITQSLVSGNWTVNGTFTASSISYPTVDGNAGDVMTTNGAGTITFQAPASSFTWNAIAGTSQAAVVNNGYVNENAGLTTITLPATFAVGDVIAVQGLGSAGWVLQASASDIIRFFGSSTSAGGSLASTARYDTVQVVGIVADGEWSVSYGGANLTVA